MSFALLPSIRRAHTSTHTILPPLLPTSSPPVTRTLLVTPPASLLPPRKRHRLPLPWRWLTARKSQYHRVHRVQCPIQCEIYQRTPPACHDATRGDRAPMRRQQCRGVYEHVSRENETTYGKTCCRSCGS